MVSKVNPVHYLINKIRIWRFRRTLKRWTRRNRAVA